MASRLPLQRRWYGSRKCSSSTLRPCGSTKLRFARRASHFPKNSGTSPATTRAAAKRCACCCAASPSQTGSRPHHPRRAYQQPRYPDRRAQRLPRHTAGGIARCIFSGANPCGARYSAHIAATQEVARTVMTGFLFFTLPEQLHIKTGSTEERKSFCLDTLKCKVLYRVLRCHSP